MPGLKDNASNFHLLRVVEYILESEEDDFNEHPSDNHVYFHAYAARYGGLSADVMFTRVMLETKEGV